MKTLKNNNILKVTSSYLEIETNYALLISGERGIGKTYFVKNKILPKIEKIKVFHDQRKYYKPIYISLYGLTNIDEIYYLLALELLPFLKSKTMKITLGISKMITRGFLQYNKLGSIDELLKDISGTSKNALDTKEFILIFDDLDRLSSNVSINEFIGFVNSLVEHENNKILIIADQNEINDDEYKAVKEKTIGTTIEYIPTFNQTFDEIIEDKYKKAGFLDYYKYLILLKEDILTLFEKANLSNLRTLIYYLQHFSKIFYSIFYDLKLDDENIHELNFKKLRIINWFTLAVSIEFKKGNLTYTNPNGINLIDEINSIIHQAWLSEAFSENANRLNDKKPEEDKKEKSFKEVFVDTFYKGQSYYFYPSIFDFITGGDDFDKEILKVELKKNVDDKRHEESESDIVYNKLSAPQCYDLSNHELRELSAKMYQFALNADYPLDRYLSIFFYLKRFDWILNYDPEEVADNLITALSQHSKEFLYHPMLKEKFGPRPEDPHFELFKKIFKKLNELNDSIKIEDSKNKTMQLFDIFINDKDEFYKIAQSDFANEEIFNNWGFDLFFSHFKLMKATEIRIFASYLKNRYAYGFSPLKETDFFKNFLEYIYIIDREQERDLRNFIIKDLVEVIKTILERDVLNQPMISFIN